MKIISNRGVTFLQGSKLKMNLHDSNMSLGGKHLF